MDRRWIAPSALAALWTSAASINPTTTFHLAPLVVATSLATLGRPPGPGWAAAAVVVTMALAIGVDTAGWMRGPSLLPGNALMEALVATVAGAVIGVVAGRRSHRVPPPTDRRP